MFHARSNYRKTPPTPNLLAWINLLSVDACANLQQLAKRYGDICKTPGRLGFYLLNEPNAIEHVLKTNYRNYMKLDLSYKGIGKVLGNNLLTNPNYDTWLHERRLLQPHFHHQQLLQFTPRVTEITLAFCQRWQRFADEEKAIDLLPEMSLLLFNILSACLFDGAFDHFDQPFCHFINLGNRYVGSLAFLMPWFPLPLTVQFKNTRRECFNIIQKAMDERRHSPKTTPDFITTLLQASTEQSGQLQTEQDIIDEILTFIVTGTETTATALAWLWYCLATNPDINANLQQELQTILNGRIPVKDDLEKLSYTRMTFEETLRLYPPLWNITRRSVNEDIINDYYIPANKTIILSPYVMQRHPQYWNNPNEFNPENFSEENKRKRISKYLYFPFGAGPRACIGNTFSLLEAQLIIPIIAQQFEFKLLAKQPIQLEPFITLRPKGGIWVKLKRKL